MGITEIEGVKIEALCGCVPEHSIDNLTIAKELFGIEAEEKIKSIGIKKRRVLKNEENSSLTLCVEAAKKIFVEKTTYKHEIGAIVFVTVSPARTLPNNATSVQHLLDLDKNIPAFDINLACSGYAYGLWISSLMAKNLNKKVLLLDGDKQSHMTSLKDKSTGLIFSDAGSATIISPFENKNKWFFNFETDGSKRDALTITDGGSENYFNENSLEYVTDVEGNSRRNIDIYMDGLGVFKYVVNQVPKNIKPLLKKIEDENINLDYLVLHQANKFMLDYVAKKLKIPSEKVPISVTDFGNSSSATVPLTIANNLSEKINQENTNMIISGFGAGLSIGSGLINIGSCFCPGVIELHE